MPCILLLCIWSDCNPVTERGFDCQLLLQACVRAHAGDLKAKGCPPQFEPVNQQFCGGNGNILGNTASAETTEMTAGHKVCDLSIGARMRAFGTH